MYKIYYLLSYICLPIILINLFLRLLIKKEDRKRYAERFGKSKHQLDKSKKTIWIHAASIGEFKSSNIIISKYYKDYNILVTTTTVSSANYIKQFYNEKVLHQYIPYDIPYCCKRFINYWRPCLILWIESDIWPNILRQIKNRKINCFYLNARISPKSYNNWIYFKKFYSSSLMTFNKIFAQSKNDLERINNLTKRKINYIGNLKLSKNKTLLNKFEKRSEFSLMIASSHEKEEEIIIKSINDIIKKNNIKLFIAPRHTNRVEEIIKILIKYKFKFTLESKIKDSNENVIIIDSFGNLKKYFNKSEIVIIGGSLIKKGGHNPLEPASQGCVIISGSNVYNWQNIYDEMLKYNACIIINEAKELKNKINDLIKDKFSLEKYKKKAFEFSNKNFFDNESLFKEIDSVIK